MAAKQTNPLSITEEQAEFAVETAIAGGKLETIGKALGFHSKVSFWRFLQKNPELNNSIKQARLDSCEFLEDMLLEVADVYSKDLARVKMESICRILAFRNPAKYSQRIDLNVNQTISISHVLENANKRVEAFLTATKDVTPKAE